jgi:MFS family permease
LTAGLKRAVASLEVPNYRRYFAGQVVSLSGNWMQTVAVMWLVVQLTGSGVSVGLTAGLQFAPMLVLGAYGGVLADRFDKRRLLLVTQALMALPCLALFALTATDAIEIWMVYALVLVRGLVTAIDNPARQAFVSEIVGADRVVNAVSLNSVIVHTARIVGPAIAGVLIALVGTATVFLIDALTFAVMWWALWGMRVAELHTVERTARARGQVREAFAEVRRRPELAIPLAMMLVIGTISFEFQVLLPLFADTTWQGTAISYALLTMAMAVGSIGGALLAGARGHVSPALLVGAAALFGVAELLASAAPSLPVQLLLLLPLGAVSVTFSAGINSSLQLAAGPGVRGRVMALYSVVFIGSTAIGGPAVGTVAQAFGPRTGLALGGVAALTTAALGAWAYARRGELYMGMTAPRVPSSAHGTVDRLRSARRRLRVAARPGSAARPGAAAPARAASQAAPVAVGDRARRPDRGARRGDVAAARRRPQRRS